MDLKSSIKLNINHFINSIDISKIKKIVDVIKNSKKNIYILGVGKNIPLAIYFADILKSINYSAFHLNCINLTHGDIGCIHETDTIIVISNSGNTSELIDNIKYINHNNNKYLITTNKKAKIIEFCNEAFIFSKTQELDGKFNLIPTSSITNFTIVFNFIIYYLMNNNNITLKEYNYNHPKGNIGLLSKKAKDIIIPLKNTCYNFITDTIDEIILNMFKYKVGYSCIVDKDMNLKGIVTDFNLRNFLINNDKLKNIENISTKNPVIIDDLEMSVSNLNKIPYLYVPVVINKKLEGIIENKFK